MVNIERSNCRVAQSAAVLFLLCSLTPCLHCFGLRELDEEVTQDIPGNETTTTGVTTGRILFDGRDLSSYSKTTLGTAEQNKGSLDSDAYQADDPGTEFTQESKEFVWDTVYKYCKCM